MKIKRKPALILLMIVSMLCLIFGAVACGGESAKDAIEKYILPQNETLVDTDFTLPKTIGKSVKVTWKSDKTDIIAIEDSGDKYTAKVTLPTEVTPVTLTIMSGEHSKDFTVRVDEFSVFTFVKFYKFPQKNVAVKDKEDFDLDTETTYQGKKATISWAIDVEKYGAYINLNEAENKVLVTAGEEVKPVEIAATFTYNGARATQKYPFSVTPILDHRQIVKNMYSEEGYALELSGYIVHVYQAKIDEKYGPEATFYMIDDDFCSGYYLYNVVIDEEQVDKFVTGAHVTVTGATATYYNGLWESKSGSGTAVIDDKTPIDPREKVYAIDTDLLADAPSLKWHESTFVSLTGWKVLHRGNYNSTSKTYEKTTGTDQNLFTLEKNGKEIVVRITKYMTRTADELAALVAVYDDVKEGEFINVTGILGNYNGFQIQPVLASDITKATAESTNTDGAKVKAAIGKVNEAVEANFSSLIAADKEVTMPTSEDGVTISYQVAGAKDPTVTINGGKFTINPTSVEHNYDIEVTYTIGNYKAYDFFKLHNWKLSDTEIVKNVKEALEEETIADINRTGEFDLPAVDDLGATITWKVKDTSLSWISVADGKIKVSSLPSEDTEVTLVATIVLNSATETVELKVKVAAASAFTFKAIDAPAAGDYIFALYQGNSKFDKWLYANGEISTNDSGDFGATTENSAEAATFTLAASGEGWTIQLKSSGKFLELNDNHRWCYVDASTQPWMWNTEAKVLTFTVSGTVYYLGTYGTFDTISASTIDRITGSNLNASGQYVAHFGTMVAAELTFKAIEAPAAGTYKFAMYNGNTKVTYYATGEMSGFYFATSENVSEAADFVITQSGNENKYTVTVGGKYLEFVPRTDGAEGVNIALNDAQTAGKYWQWNEAIKNFVFESTYNKGDSADATDTDLYYLGTYDTYTTMSGNYIGRIATKGDDGSYTANGKEGVNQWVAHFGTMEVGEPGATEPEEPEHVHNYTYTYDTETGWQHKGHCDVEGCPEPDITEECAPVLNHCEKCDRTYTQDEILTKLFESPKNTTLSGTYSLTGKVLRIDTPYDAEQYYNVTFTIKVGDKEVQCYREKSDHSATVKPGDTVTVQGTLKHYSNGTKEFDANCAITALTAGELTDEEKVSEVLRKLTLPASASSDVTLPTSSIEGVQLTWASDNQAFAIDGNTLKVVPQNEEVTLKITVTAKSGSAEDTKEFTVIVPAKLPEGAETISVTISEYATAHEWQGSGSTKYSSIEADEQVTITTTGKESGTNNGKYYASNGSWRLYSSENATLTISVKAGYHLVSVKITWGSGSFSATDAIKSGVAKAVSGTSVTFTVNANIQITAIEVIYVADTAAATSVAPVAILPGKEF